MKKVLLLMTFIACVLGMGAQNTKVITGAVIDKNGNPLPNALVEATGGAESTTTDADGSFRIEVPIWLKSLTAKYASMKDKTVKIKNDSPILFEMSPDEVKWFINGAYSITVGDATLHRIGLMGGRLDNWGGYAKILVPIYFPDGKYHEGVPSVTLGVIKQIATPVYMYLGAGYSPVFFEHFSYGTTYWDYESGGMFDIGAIFRFNKVNFNVGYSVSTEFNDWINHSVQISVGYCF